MATHGCTVPWSRAVSGGQRRDEDAIAHRHHAAHERCDTGNSLRGEVRIEGHWRFAD